MSRPDRDPGLPDSFRDRVDAYCSELIEADDFRTLEDELVANEAARRYFVDYLRLHAELGFAARARRAAAAALSRFEGREVAVVARPAPRPGADGRPRPGRRAGLRRLALGGLAAAVGLVGVGLVVIPRGGRMAAVFTPTNPAAAPQRPANVAWLVNAQDCRWAEGTEAPGRDMAAGKVLSLDRGLAEVEFECGARVILQGPAALRLLSGSRAELSRGSLAARVPAAAHGFTVLSPQGEVVDLGTEFGVAVDAGGTTSVRVFAGELTAAAVGPDAGRPVHLRAGQEAWIAGHAVAVEDRGGRPAARHEFARAIVPPPVIRPRTLRLDFDRPVDGSLLDAEGLGIGLTRRLAGTGAALLGRDPNLRLRTDRGALELTTTRSDLNKQVGLDEGEYLGVPLAALGFTRNEDFTISAEVHDIPGLDVVGQFGLYAGVGGDRAIRGGVLRQPEANRYGLFLVNNVNGIDQDIHEIGMTTTGDDLRFTLRREGGAYSFSVENRTKRSTSTLAIAPSPFLDDRADLDVGLFGANTQSDVRKTLTIRHVEVTVSTRDVAETALARATAEGDLPRR